MGWICETSQKRDTQMERLRNCENAVGGVCTDATDLVTRNLKFSNRYAEKDESCKRISAIIIQQIWSIRNDCRKELHLTPRTSPRNSSTSYWDWLSNVTVWVRLKNFQKLSVTCIPRTRAIYIFLIEDLVYCPSLHKIYSFWSPGLLVFGSQAVPARPCRFNIRLLLDGHGVWAWIQLCTSCYIFVFF